MELDANFISIKNFYEQIDARIIIGEGNITIKNVFYKENVVGLSTEV